LCGYSQPDDAEIKWIVKNGYSSVNTGPTVDHTTQTYQGQYAVLSKFKLFVLFFLFST
jgi:hypothetical protein